MIRHDDVFATTTLDEEWLKAVGRKKLITLSKDAAIRKRPNEKNAIEEAKVVAFLLTSANLTGADMAVPFVQALPQIIEFAAATTGPAIYTFGKDGKPKLIS